MQREIQAQINCSSVVKGEVRRVVRDAHTVWTLRARHGLNWMAGERGQNEGEFMPRVEMKI